MQTVDFQVSMEVASRADLTLTINYRDGDVRTFDLRSENDTLSENSDHLQPDDTQVGIKLEAGYGQGCVLVLSLRHTYTDEGIYTPEISVRNNHTNQSLVLPVSLTVQLKLTEVYVVIGKKVVSAGEPISLPAVVKPNIAGDLIITWNITDLYRNKSKPDIVVTARKQLTYTFRVPSTYELTVGARNLISDVWTQFQLQAEVPVAGLELSYDRNRRYVKVGERVTFHARVRQGSNVDFEWDFHDRHDGQNQPIYGELTSTAVHFFTKPGHFIVTVRAFTPLNHVFMTLSQSIVVQASIGGVLLDVPPAVSRSNPARITATVLSGTDVNFDFDYGVGRRPASQLKHNGTVTEVYGFDTVGEHNVTVYAYNEISAANWSSCIQVQDVLSDVTVVAKFVPILKEQVVFLVMAHGKTFFVFLAAIR
ncbi:hypothetical protein LSH36_153g03036 [Paralvinella palmiformis]|uniref:PKD domain-containing protein n=1 Tax=Paralvinella palmiformis TaxID=53620 RepID=A0AAD9JV93_9ANNE|nr:hypothetical protein LSH36_153g03036 [Paralvinella palmiformis]